MTAHVWIGGDLPRSRSHVLVLAVRTAGVSTGQDGFEDVTCKPRSVDGLMEALTDGVLHLQGEPDRVQHVVETAHQLGLSYRHWNEGVLEVEARDIDVPLTFAAPLPEVPLVDHADVRKGIVLLKGGETVGALLVLERVCPEIPDLPPLRLVQG